MQVKGDEMETFFFFYNFFSPFFKAFSLCLFVSLLLSDCIVSSALISPIFSLRLAEP